MTRRLAAILAADVAGYSRLIEQDEAGTLAALRERRKAVLDPTVARHHGRVVKVMGDGVLVEFGSAVNAVACAVELQKQFAAANEGVAEDRRIVLRVGINLGDVVVEGGDLYGDGVIIAVRLQAMAEPGGICISGSVHEQVAGKLDAAFNDLGSCEVKNSSKPVRVFRVKIDGAEPVQAAATLPSKPSIAVLPFTNMSGDPEQQYFSDGITEDIITELSRFRTLFVIARNSTFQFRDKPLGIAHVAQQLGARYIVEGSVRKNSGRIRINVQLVDAAANSNVWSERYDRELKDIFAIQDEVTQAIVSPLVGRLETAELMHARRRPADNLEVYECLYRAKSLMNATGSGENKTVQALLERAISLDPECGRAHALLAMTYVFDWQHSDSPKDLDKAFDAARLALAKDDQDSWCHFAYGFACMHRHLFGQAQEHYDLALALNPNDADIIANMGELLNYRGKPEESIDWIKQAMRLNPLHPPSYWNDLAGAYYDSHRYRDAIAAFLQMPQPFYSHDVYLAACYGQLGDSDNARRHAEAVMKSMPDFSAHNFVAGEPFEREADSAHLLEGLRKAGLPE